MLNIIVAEDHALLREGLTSLLRGNKDINVVAEACNGEEAIKYAEQYSPDIILMDLNMPIVSGIDALKKILQFNDAIKIIAVTAHESEEYVRSTLEAGAKGYVLKDDTHKDLLQAINAVSKGNIYLSPGIREKIVQSYIQAPQGVNDNTLTSSKPLLTKREKEITLLIANGLTNREIGIKLSISLKTVEKHRANLMKKLNLHNASAITKYAIENDLI
ncbi:MAG: DNA-binding response regulator [Kangiella sp.]|nr:MAG: DNA-binding response regulator [Kangiella sp.]